MTVREGQPVSETVVHGVDRPDLHCTRELTFTQYSLNMADHPIYDDACCLPVTITSSVLRCGRGIDRRTFTATAATEV